MSETTKTELLQQGLTAARVGDLDDARRLLTQATEQMPNNVEAWLGLAGVVEPLTEKQECFQKVLALDPDNGEAKAGLALVEQKLAAQAAGRSTDGARTTSEEATGPQTESGVTVCYRHPQTETGLRCNRCNKPICPKCAHRTPVGFRCPDCIREQENKYYTGGNLDYVIAGVVAFPLSLIVAALLTFILGGFGFFTLIIGFIAAPFAAGIIAETVRWAVGRRRSRYLRHIVAGALILATAPFILLLLLNGNFWTLLGPGLFAFLGTTTVLTRLR
ncbi:MAG TPA: tetratricopeptide repeat protein [Anaerolineae bacterium]